ncbi:MAG: UMP kinase [Acidobacteria bacterium]|nr:UMP kinase [Acidobacteriota bacterium]MDW7983905.1 UMP kinase [Acidobacteriota bacterium]
MHHADLRYRRILLKLSGEAFRGHQPYGIDYEFLKYMAQEIGSVHELGVQIAIVVGGGNILRGSEAALQGLDRALADYIGMLATLMNALALQDMLERHGMVTRCQSALEVKEVAEPLIRRRAIRHLEKGRVVIFAAGTGNPFFSTDTAAALRALEIRAEVLLKATKVEGIFTDDPLKNLSARKLSHVSYQDFLQMGLRVMDSTAISLCMEHGLPVIVFNIWEAGNLRRIVLGEPVGSTIGPGRGT